jgi:hypothetical protein
VLGTKRQQMGSSLLSRGRAAYTFAIKGDGFICLCYQRGTYPIGQGPLQMLCADARQQVALERIARAEKPTRAEEPC